MKRLALLAAVALSTVALAVSAPAASFYETTILTRAAPTLVTEGMSIHGVPGYRVSVCAESGQTLSGTGYLRAYAWHPVAALWMRNPSLDYTVSATATRCQVFPDLQVAAQPEGWRVLFAADTIAVSGGTTVTTRIDGPRI